MIEHPVPQNITAYQFHLIGNMTVKQFLMLLAGAGVGFLFYTTNLPSLVKWTFIIFFFGLSAAAAFVPYEDRTLDQWIINFIRAIYRPTKYYWRRHPKLPDYLSYRPLSTTQETSATPAWAPQKRQQVQAYLSSLQSGNQAAQVDPLDIFTNHTAAVTELFTSVKAAANVTPGTEEVVDRPNLTVRARPLRRPQEVFRAEDVTMANAGTQAAPKKVMPQYQPSHRVSTVHQEKESSNPKTPAGSISPNEQRLARSAATIQVANVATNASPVQEEPQAPITSSASSTSTDQSYVAAEKLTSSSMGSGTIVPAVFDRSLPFPSLPTDPNVLVGMVHDHDNKIVSDAIIEILDEKGNTVRAMKTNTLGQFYISSALKPGTYHIETEKDDLTFPVYELTAADTVLDPINIQAQ